MSYLSAYTVRERDVERYLVEQLSKQHLACVKFIPDNEAGMPDRLVLLPDGKCLWVELKRESGRLSDLQRYQHERLRRAGQTVRVVWNKEDADALIREIG